MHFTISLPAAAAVCAALLLGFSCGSANAAKPAPPADRDALIGDEVVGAIRALLANPIVGRSIRAQNAKYGALDQTEIDRLDKQWRAERESDDKPLISMTLSNPLSSYLTREQANSIGLYAAIFVTDRNGLNVGQSAITGDFWQGDEAKFQKTFPNGAGALFIDEPEWLDEAKVWIVQVNLTVADETSGAPIGAATFDLNITELQRRVAASAAE